MAAARGRSRKVLALDLDNTLWGGVIGDDGMEGIDLGQGTGTGEAYVAFQRYVKDLKMRGVVLAICSKNDPANALAPFKNHNEMVLKTDDFGAILANWDDKATNLKEIAKKLNLGLDSIVFFDDNPAERALVRQYLPMIAVPEVPEDPADYASCLARSGLFESFVLTKEDQIRAEQYRAESKRRELQTAATNIEEYLAGLKMDLAVAPFDEAGASRISQLINKSNQYNLTTRRYTLEQVKEMIGDKNMVTYQFQLKDRFGDNGMISVIITKPAPTNGQFVIDTWLMSCRVLGRCVEQEVLNCLAAQMKKRGAKTLIGEYIPTEKNQMVEGHYTKLGFKPGAGKDRKVWTLDLESFTPFETPIKVTWRGQ